MPRPRRDRRPPRRLAETARGQAAPMLLSRALARPVPLRPSQSRGAPAGWGEGAVPLPSRNEAGSSLVPVGAGCQFGACAVGQGLRRRGSTWSLAASLPALASPVEHAVGGSSERRNVWQAPPAGGHWACPPVSMGVPLPQPLQPSLIPLGGRSQSECGAGPVYAPYAGVAGGHPGPVGSYGPPPHT